MQICHNHSIHVVVVQIETPTVSGVYQCTAAAKLQFEPLYKMAGQCLVYIVSQKYEQLYVDIQCYTDSQPVISSNVKYLHKLTSLHFKR